jgi:hypothetical protein
LSKLEENVGQQISRAAPRGTWLNRLPLGTSQKGWKNIGETNHRLGVRISWLMFAKKKTLLSCCGLGCCSLSSSAILWSAEIITFRGHGSCFIGLVKGMAERSGPSFSIF